MPFPVSSDEPRAFQYAPDLSIEPIHLEIRARFDKIEEREVAMDVTTTFRCNRILNTGRVGIPASSPSTWLDGVGFTELRVVPAAATAATDATDLAFWRYDGQRLDFAWKEPFARVGQTRTVRVTYRVVRPSTALIFSFPTVERPRLNRHVCSDHETERARHWILCRDQPAVRTTVDWYLTARKEDTCLANGVLVGEEPVEGEPELMTTRWSLDERCPSYLLCVAVGDFVRVDDHASTFINSSSATYKEVKVSLFTQRASLQGIDFAGGITAAFGHGQTGVIMKWLTDLVAQPFPYPKYYQFALPFAGGAMENISLTSWDQMYIVPDCANWRAERFNEAEAVNVHEMTHSFFGDSIVMAHFEHAWLKESWATYTPLLFSRDTVGESAFRWGLLRCMWRYVRESKHYTRPIVCRRYDSSWDIFDMHTYPGGAWRIHMLLKLLGEEAFWQGVRAYVARYMGKVVETIDFQRELERAAPGVNLTRFFEQWFHSPGFPRLRAKLTWDSTTSVATLTSEQIQSQHAFELDIPVIIHCNDEKGNDTQHVFMLVFTDSKHASFTHRLEGPPQRVEIDPEWTVLFEIDSCDLGEDVWRKTLLHHYNVSLASLQKTDLPEASTITHFEQPTDSLSWVDPRLAVWCVRHLLDCGTQSSVRAVCSWAVEGQRTKEIHFGTRIFVFEHIVAAARLHDIAVQTVADLIEGETHAVALRDCLQMCLEKPVLDVRIRRVLRSRIAQGNTPRTGHGLGFVALSRALEFLGLQQGCGLDTSCQEDEELLIAFVEAGRDHSSKDFGLLGLVQQGALKGLAGLETPSAFDFLLRTLKSPRFLADAVEGGIRDDAQAALVTAVARSAAAQRLDNSKAKSAASQAIIDSGCLRRDGSFPEAVSHAALNALTKTLASREHLPTLRAYIASAPDQDAVEARSAVAEMESKLASSAGSAAGRETAAALDAAVKRISVLEEKLERLSKARE